MLTTSRHHLSIEDVYLSHVDLRSYCNLQSLSLMNCLESVTDDCIRSVSRLTSLSIMRGSTLTDEALYHLPLLQRLSVSQPHAFTSTGIASLSDSLRFLTVSDDIVCTRERIHWLQDEAVCLCTQLACLTLSYCRGITGRNFHQLHRLSALTVVGRSNFDGDVLKTLPGLTSLIFTGDVFDDSHIAPLHSKLRVLRMGRATRITDASVACLTRLRVLSISNTSTISGKCLGSLTALHTFSISDSALEGKYLSLLPSSVRAVHLFPGMVGPTEFAETHLCSLTSLVKLSVGNLPFSMETAFPLLTNLRRLVIRSMGAIQPAAFWKVPVQLCSFSLDFGFSTDTSTIPTNAVTRLTNLTHLHIPYQRDAHVSHLLPLEKLQRLVVRDGDGRIGNILASIRPSLLVSTRRY
jgi:hypothetical protein